MSWWLIVDYPITGYIVIDVFSVVSDVLHHPRWDETLPNVTCEDERCAPEWCSLTSLGPPEPVTNEEIIRAYHIVPVTIRK